MQHKVTGIKPVLHTPCNLSRSSNILFQLISSPRIFVRSQSKYLLIILASLLFFGIKLCIVSALGPRQPEGCYSTKYYSHQNCHHKFSFRTMYVKRGTQFIYLFIFPQVTENIHIATASLNLSHQDNSESAVPPGSHGCHQDKPLRILYYLWKSYSYCTCFLTS